MIAKNILLLLFTFSLFIVKGQTEKAENLSDLKNKENIYSSIIAKDIAKNVGLSSEIETQISSIYSDFNNKVRLQRQNNPKTTSTQLPVLEKERELQIEALLNDKQMEKYKKYLESKKE